MATALLLAGLAAALISCGVPALLRGLPAPYAHQALQVLTSGTGKMLEPFSTSGRVRMDSMTGAQICETREFQAALEAAESSAGKGSAALDLEDLCKAFR
jgi:hypothetical protein